MVWLLKPDFTRVPTVEIIFDSYDKQPGGLLCGRSRETRKKLQFWHGHLLHVAHCEFMTRRSSLTPGRKGKGVEMHVSSENTKILGRIKNLLWPSTFSITVNFSGIIHQAFITNSFASTVIFHALRSINKDEMRKGN